MANEGNGGKGGTSGDSLPATVETGSQLVKSVQAWLGVSGGDWTSKSLKGVERPSVCRAQSWRLGAWLGTSLDFKSSVSSCLSAPLRGSPLLHLLWPSHLSCDSDSDPASLPAGPLRLTNLSMKSIPA